MSRQCNEPSEPSDTAGRQADSVMNQVNLETQQADEQTLQQI